MGLRQSSANQSTSYPSLHFDTSSATLHQDSANASKKKLTDKDMKSLSTLSTLSYDERVLAYQFESSLVKESQETSFSSKNSKSLSKQRNADDFFQAMPKDTSNSEFRAVNSFMYHRIQKQANPFIPNKKDSANATATATATDSNNTDTAAQKDINAALISLQQQADEMEDVFSYGGRGSMRLYHTMSHQAAAATVFIVANQQLSGASAETLQTVQELKSTLQSFLYNPSMHEKPILILLKNVSNNNKKAAATAGTVTPQQLAEVLQVSDEQGFMNKDWRIQSCSFADHGGLLAAFTWLDQALKRQQARKLTSTSKFQPKTKTEHTYNKMASKLKVKKAQEQLTATATATQTTDSENIQVEKIELEAAEFPSVDKVTIYELPTVSHNATVDLTSSLTDNNVAKETINIVPAAA